METYSTFTSKEDFQQNLLTTIETTGGTLAKIKKSLNQDLCLTNKDSYHFITQFIKPRNRVEHALFSLLYRDIYQSEVISGNSAKITLTFALKMLAEVIKCQELLPANDSEALKAYEDTVEHFKKHLESKAVVATKKSLEDIVFYLCDGDDDLAFVIVKTLEAAGIEGKIFVEDSKQPNYLVESRTGHSFKLSPFGFMMPNSLGASRWERTEVKILIVDGLIEKVSEFDQILNKAMETKQPLAIVAHGFSEEVVATIKANNDIGNFDIMPIRMHHDLSSINTIKDIGVVCNTTPVTHMLGNLLTFIKWEDLKTIDRIKVERATTTFEAKENRQGVAEHTKDLVAKRQSPDTIEDVRNLLDERLRSMASHSVILRLPNMSTLKSDSHRIKIDLCLRNCKTILGYGTVNLEDVVDTYVPRQDNHMDKVVLSSLQQVVSFLNQQNSSVVLPTLSTLLGVTLAGKTCLKLVTASGFVELTDIENT